MSEYQSIRVSKYQSVRTADGQMGKMAELQMGRWMDSIPYLSLIFPLFSLIGYSERLAMKSQRVRESERQRDRGVRGRTGVLKVNLLGAEADLFEDDLFKGVLVSEAPDRVKDLDAGELTLGIVVGGYAFAKLLGGDSGLLESNIKGVNLRVVCDAHIKASFFLSEIIGINSYYDDFILFIREDRSYLFGLITHAVPRLIKDEILAAFETAQFRARPFGGPDGFGNLFFGCPPGNELVFGVLAEPDRFGAFVHRNDNSIDRNICQQRPLRQDESVNVENEVTSHKSQVRE